MYPEDEGTKYKIIDFLKVCSFSKASILLVDMFVLSCNCIFMLFFCSFVMLGESSATFNYFAVRAIFFHLKLLEILALVGNFKLKALSQGGEL